MSPVVDDEKTYVMGGGPVTVPITDAGGSSNGGQPGRDAGQSNSGDTGGDDKRPDAGGGNDETPDAGADDGDDDVVGPDAGDDQPGDNVDDEGPDDAPSACVPSECDDGIACTTDGCSAAGECIHLPDDTRCGVNETCSPTQGCVQSTTNTCSESPCKLVSPQCGCGAGQGCYPNAQTLEPECTTAGTRTLGQSCTTINGCAPGLLCVGGFCYKACESDFDCSLFEICYPLERGGVPVDLHICDLW